MDIQTGSGHCTNVKKGLRSVLEYTEHLLATRIKVLSDLDREAVARFHEADVANLEGVAANVDAETWLRFERIRETRPPEPDPMFEGWYDLGSHPSADVPPELKSELIVRLSVEQISDLFEAGIMTDLMDILSVDPKSSAKEKRQMDGQMDVILHSANMPEFALLWRSYVEGPWTAWARIERPRRKSIETYNALYQINQRMMSFGEDAPVEMVFGLGVARWAMPGERLNVPVIEQSVELEMDEVGRISVRPRQFVPQIVLAAFHQAQVEGSESAQKDIGERFERTVDDPDVGFSPFEKSTFESVLRTCATRLSEKGIYQPDENGVPENRRLPPIDGVLRITDTWVLYARQRTEDSRRNDIRRLIKRIDGVQDDVDLPQAGVRFVTPPSDVVVGDSSGDYIDLTSGALHIPDGPRIQDGQGTGGSGAGASTTKDKTLFFPLAYNEEQEAVITRLEDPNTFGCNVQGPPGTGKTHTIANIVCHYMATGRRVLVTAKTPEALTALHEKIPEGIRDLAISVIHNDREGARQLEHAVRILAETVKSIQPRQVSEEIRDKQMRLAAIRDEVSLIEGKLQSFAEKNLTKTPFRGADIGALDLAKVVAAEREEHAWFLDLVTPEEMKEPLFTPDEVDEIKFLRQKLGNDLIYAASELPKPTELPVLANILAAHNDLGRLAQIEDRENAGDLPFMALNETATLDHAKATFVWLQELEEFMAEAGVEAWALDVYQILLGVRKVDEALGTRLHEEVEVWSQLHQEGAKFLLRDLKLDHPPVENIALDKAIDDYSSGRKPGGMFGLLKGSIKVILDRIELDGAKPSSPEDWQTIRDYRTWQKETARFAGRWTGFARAAGAPTLPTDPVEANAEFMRMGRLVRMALQFRRTEAEHRANLKRLFPFGLDVNAVVSQGTCAGAIEALAANIERAALVDAQALLSGLYAIALERVETIKARDAALGFSDMKKRPAQFFDVLGGFCDMLGNPEVPASEIAKLWHGISNDSERLHGQQIRLERLDTLTQKVAKSGALRWAELMRYRPADGDDDFIPDDWRKPWDWAIADFFLKQLGKQDVVRALTDRRGVIEAEQRKLFAEVIRLRTFLGLKKNLTEKIDSALSKFTTAVARLGKGTGKGAPRQLRLIREAAHDAARGVPCWILPEWRVAEQLPSELGIFDLVVVDEASQSDITVFPILLRGKKVLIVGDDKQVSPTVIGIEERQVAQLRATFLTDLPFAHQMDPATSLYELGGMVFPGKATMLREHFRCVEPIIRFSSRFYGKPLLPLRIPKTSERLDPPLIDIYVPHGRKDGDINMAEVDMIVSEIVKLTEDPRYAKLSFGVISLIGTNQSVRIYARLVEEIGTDKMEKHRIMCGNPSTFQGQERDIIFLSMVACPRTAISQSARNIEQRFNVAASRARDRLVLVRSVAASDLKLGDLKLALIEHFRNPMEGGNVAPPSDILDLCGSGFERDFGRRMLDMGYRLRAQVPVAGYYIDFVIEGDGDRRLAIELDGDNYHGPDRWAADIRRQKMLERLGWTFWRCWGSSWYVDPDGCLADLMETLKHLEIEPIGMLPITMHYTDHITVQASEVAEEPAQPG